MMQLKRVLMISKSQILKMRKVAKINQVKEVILSKVRWKLQRRRRKGSIEVKVLKRWERKTNMKRKRRKGIQVEREGVKEVMIGGCQARNREGEIRKYMNTGS